MTTNTEALRAQFERKIGEAAPFPVERDGDSYVNRMCAWAWEGYQAGHAAAKAEAAAAGAPMAMVQCHGSAEHPLYTADQLAAAVAAERGKCAGIVNELRMECARRNMPESATMLWHAEDAIRAGAKEAGY